MIYSLMLDIVNEVSKNTIGQYFHMAMTFKLEEWTCSFHDGRAPVTTFSLFHDAFGVLFIPVHTGL